MDSVASLLPKILRKRGVKDEADASFLVFVATQWLQEHGAALGNDVTPTKFTAGTLVIEASSSILAQECMALSEGLLEHLRKQFPGITIERVRIMRQRGNAPQGA